MILTSEFLSFSGLLMTAIIFLVGFVYKTQSKKDEVINKRFENRDALVKELEKEIGYTKENYNDKFEKVYCKIDKMADKVEQIHADLSVLIGEHRTILKHHKGE